LAPKIVDREERQRAIALTSVEIFGEKGFERTRMADVAKAAGIGKGTIYEYFKTKDDLMEGAVMALFADMADGLMPDMDADKSAAEILVAMLEMTFESIKAVAFAYRFFLEYMIHNSRQSDASPFLAEILNGYRQWLSTLLQRGIEAGEFRADLDTYATAAAIAAWVDGAVFHWFTLPDTVSLETMGQMFIETTLNGLRPRPTDDEEA